MLNKKNNVVGAIWMNFRKNSNGHWPPTPPLLSENYVVPKCSEIYDQILSNRTKMLHASLISTVGSVSLSRLNFPKRLCPQKLRNKQTVLCLHDVYSGVFEVITVRESWTWNCGGPWRRGREAFLCAVPWINTSDTTRTQVYNIFCNQSIDCFGYSKYSKHPKSPDMLPSAHQITWSWTM